ncbi:hypothetical protein Gogos_021532 [Gossypium gossypioides]|uniref:Uncharacterized protein n=1 Tax=Gossypium gossypioides TaxID=34282 RepID=A0A7J9D3D7_GOSGO|nr:hypothetical protein [Gossypium gossypioides]
MGNCISRKVRTMNAEQKQLSSHRWPLCR